MNQMRINKVCVENSFNPWIVREEVLVLQEAALQPLPEKNVYVSIKDYIVLIYQL